MKRPHPIVTILLLLTLLLTGCVATELRVTNRTGGSIQFYTGHTKKAFQIQDGATVTVPHTAGRVVIITQQDEVWEYKDVPVPDFPDELIKGFKRLTLPISIGGGGVITLPSGKTFQPSQKVRPTQ